MAQIRSLSFELAEKAKLELNEVPARLPEDIEMLRGWLAKQSHIRSRTDDQFLVCFLRGCKFSIERAKEKLDMFYTIRTAIPEFFTNRDPSNLHIQHIVDLGVNLPLPYTVEPDGPRLFLCRLGAFEPSKITLVDVMKVCYMITDVMLMNCDNSIIAGHTILVDMRGLSFSVVAQSTPQLIKKMTSVIEAYPIRTKAINFVNPSAAFDALFRLFHGFLSEKIKKRVMVHDSFEALHKVIPKKFLPEEYGGNCGTLASISGDWKNQLLAQQQWFNDDVNYGTDEKNRPGKPKNATTLFGVEGSFRTLDVD